MHINEKLELYLNEIISKDAWKAQYGVKFYETFDAAKYREIIGQLTKLFGKLSKGKPKRTLVFDFGEHKPVSLPNKFDWSLIDLLHNNGYKCEKYQSGIVEKDGKEKSVFDILKGMQSRAHPEAKKRMKDQYERKPIPQIKQQLEFIEELEKIGLIRNGRLLFGKLTIAENNKRKIVFTYDHRAIASQSTEVGWTSCMNLNKGGYSGQVGAGASSGVFIAYLVKPGDEYTLESPSARVLFKPYEGKYTGKLYWKADKIYGTASDEFRKKAQEIVDKVQGKVPKESDIYDITSDTYRDDLPVQLYSLSDEEKQVKQNPRLIIHDIENPSEKLKIIAVNSKPEIIKDLENPSEKVQIEAIKNDGTLIKHIKNPSEKVQLAAIKQNPISLQFIDNPSEKIQLELVKQTENALKYIKNPSKKVQLEAIKNYPGIIENMPNPSEEIQLIAVKNSGLAIRHIDNPSKKVQLAAIKNTGSAIKYIDNPSEEMQLEAIKYNEYIIQFIKNPTEKVQLEAVKKNGRVIEIIPNPSEKVQLEAIKEDEVSIQFIKNPSEKVQLEAVKKDIDVISFIDNPTEKVKLTALKKDGRLIRLIENPTQEMKIVAVTQNPLAIQYLNDYDEEVKEAARKSTERLRKK